VAVRGGRGGLGRTLRALDRQLAALARRPPDAAELDRVVARWRGWYARATDELSDRAAVLADCLVATGEADCLPAELAAREALRPADVARVARQWLSDDRRVLLSVVPRPDLALPGSVPSPSARGRRSCLSTRPPRRRRPAPPSARSRRRWRSPGPGARRSPRSAGCRAGRRCGSCLGTNAGLVRIELSLLGGHLDAADPAAARLLGRLLDVSEAGREALAALGATAELGVGGQRLRVALDAVRAPRNR